MNTALFSPKKSEREKCCHYKAGNLSVTDFKTHIKLKDRARLEKRNDKKCV